MLEKFTVMDLVHTRSASVATVTGKGIKFNPQTVAELDYPQFVQFLIDTKQKRFAIQDCEETDQNAVSFCPDGASHKGPIIIKLPAISAQIFRMAGWAPGESWNVPGIYLASENGLLYVTETAVKPAHRTIKRRKKSETATEAPDSLVEGQETEGAPASEPQTIAPAEALQAPVTAPQADAPSETAQAPSVPPAAV